MKVKLKRAGGYDPRLGRSHPDNRDPTLEFAIGDRVFGVVEWPNGRRTTSEGNLLCFDNGKAYIETSIGPVEADASTLVKVDG